MGTYECERCGCRLDPGEGRYCEDCLEEITEEAREQRNRVCSDEKELAYA